MLTASCSGMFEKYISFFGLCLKYGLLAVFWDLNFYTGPKMERLERG